MIPVYGEQYGQASFFIRFELFSMENRVNKYK